MSITINDLKIYESEVMSNAANGGGGMTTNAIIDGASNNIFDDVSEPDRAYGKVNQRKMFMACKSPNNDKLFSALTYISKLPPDEKINVNLVKTQGYFDTVNARVIDTKTSTVSTLHDAVTTTILPTTVVTPTVFAPPFNYANTKYDRISFGNNFHISNEVNKTFDCFLDGNISSGATEIKIFGFDGLKAPLTGDNSSYLYGITALKNVFMGNNFYLADALKNEFFNVTDVIVSSYVDASITDANEETGAFSYAYISGGNITYLSYATDPYLLRSPSDDVVILKPVKKFYITLKLNAAIQNNYIGGASTDSTQFSIGAWVRPVNAMSITTINAGSSTTKPAYTTYATITTKELFTAKKITAPLSNNATSIAVTDNENNVIPSVNGIILSDSILGVNTSEFSGGYTVKKQIVGNYKVNQTITLPDQNLVSIVFEYLFGGAYSVVTPTWFTSSTLDGTVTTTALFYEHYDNYRITYEVNSDFRAFLSGDIVAIINDKETVGTYSAAQTVTLTRTNLAKISVRDSAKNLIDESKFTTDLTAGTITFTSVSGLSQPLTIIDRIEDFGLVQSVTGNVLSLYKPVTHDFPILNTVVSNCMYHGDLQATASTPFDQQTWTNVWSDALIGSSTTAQFNQIDYPIVVSNRDTPTDRWILLFKTATTFDVIGEHLGAIATNQSISVNLAPINPHTAQPYFTIVANGFGGGWSAGNVIRFNTYSASAPFWCVQTIAQGTATDSDFNFAIEVRGDIDAL